METQRIDPPTLLIADNQRLFAEAIAYMLSCLRPDWMLEVCTSASDLKNKLAGNMPGIVLMEIAMRDINGLDYIRELRKKNIRPLVLSHVTNAKAIRAAIKNGAQGYFSKTTTAEELVNGIVSVMQGECYIGEDLKKGLISSVLSEESIQFSNLSPREKEVLQKICSGKTIKEAAAEMELSPNTLKTYYRAILKKFNLNRASDLIVMALKHGLYVPAPGYSGTPVR
jgi:DNA-binding NarL/FixJ family response regulator